MRVMRVFVKKELQGDPDQRELVVSEEFDKPSDDAQLKFIEWVSGGCFVTWTLPQGLDNSLLEVL